MIYSLNISTPANTAYTARQLTRMYVTKGLVYKIEISYPPGSHGLLHCFIMDGGYSVWPSSPGQTFIGDDCLISFEDVYIKNSAPFLFDIFTYNEDDTYPHKLIVRIGLVSADIFMARYLPTLAFDLYSEKIALWEKQQKEEQERSKQEVIKQPFSWIV